MRERTRAGENAAPRFAGTITLGVALVGIFAAGCGSRQPDIKPLSFWNGFSGPDGKTMKRIVDEFDSASPSTPFEMQIIPWATYYDKVTLSLAFGGAPDVFVLQSERVPFYANSGAIARLDDLYRSSGMDESDFVASAWKKGTWKGSQYAIPLDCHMMTLYYNKKLFREAGISRPPRNYQEFLDDTKRLTHRDSGGSVTQWGYEFTNLYTQAENFMNQFGGAVLDDRGERSTLTAPGSYQGLALMKHLIEDEKVAPNPEGQNAWDAFKVGKAAMVEEGIYMVADLEAQKGLEFGAAPVPQLGTIPGVWASSHMLCMPANLSPSRKLAAWKLIKYLSDHSLEWCQAGQCPVRKSILSSPEFAKLTSESAAASQMAVITYEPPTLDESEVSSFAGPAFEQVLMSGVPALRAMPQAEKRIDAALKR